MRIKLTLKPLERKTVIPINYNYPLSSAIYKILSNASKEYAEWLHNKGYISSNNKPMKLFAFSRLEIPNVEQQRDVLIINNFVNCSLLISSPMLEDFVQNFVIGLFEEQKIDIGSKYTVGRFKVETVETLPAPSFQEQTKFKCLSPITVSTMDEKNDKLGIHYYRPDDERLSEAIRKNLLRKYTSVYKKNPSDDIINFEIDKDYVSRKGGYDKITKLIWIKEGDKESETKVKSFIAPFELKGSVELMQIAYECGIGDKNSLGFGMIDLVS